MATILRTSCAAAALLALAAAGARTAQVSRPSSEARAPAGPAAFVFEYRPRPGMEARFEEGYRRHLEWHAQKHDPLPWYGWSVTTGDRVGVFVDGSFGIPFEAFDRRVEPAADGEDFDRTAAPFADALSRRVYRLRAGLSTAQPLEDRTAAANLEVLHVLVKPAAARAFEDALARLRSPGAGGAPPRFTTYQLVAGGDMPGYMLMIARDGWGAFDTASPSPFGLLAGAESGAPREPLAAALGDAAARVVSETWTYRSDLSLLPPAPSR